MTQNQTFFITNWCGVPHKFIRNPDGTLAVDRFVQAKAAGINLIAAYDYGKETNCEVLAACQKLGMQVMLEDSRVSRALHDASHREQLLAEAVRDYADYPALRGYHVVDEPNSGAFKALGEIREILSRLDPDREAYFNLFPNYASAEMLGNPTYYDHVSAFAKTVAPEIISYDHYHFLKGVAAETREIADARERGIYEAAYNKVDRPGFFDNIEDVRRVSLESGIPFMIIILVVEHGPYRNLTEAEIRYEVFQSLAYGIKRLSYFTYWTPGVDTNEGDDMWHWKNGMITKDGKETPHYHMIAAINKELSLMGDLLMPRRTEAVFHIGKEPDASVTYWPGRYAGVTSVAGDRLTLGFFDHGLILLANKDFENANVATLTVGDGYALSRFDKLTGLWEAPVSGALEVPLGAGDGELIRVTPIQSSRDISDGGTAL